MGKRLGNKEGLVFFLGKKPKCEADQKKNNFLRYGLYITDKNMDENYPHLKQDIIATFGKRDRFNAVLNNIWRKIKKYLTGKHY